MEIRKMSIQDYDGVYQLWLNTSGMGLNNLDDSREGIEKYLSRNPNTCFVAIKDDEIIGVIIGGHDGRRGYIYHLAVAANERQQGVASTLVKFTVVALAEEGISKVALVVFANNELGNGFWEKQGFTLRNDLIYRNKAIKTVIRIDT